MIDPVYEKLIPAMNSRSTILPSVKCDEYFAMVSFMFTPEQAEIAAAMPLGFATVKEIAANLPGMDIDKLGAQLEIMANKGLIHSKEKNGGIVYELLPFMPGSVELITYKKDDPEYRWKFDELLSQYTKAIWKMEKTGVLPPPGVPAPGRKVPVDREVLNQSTVIPYKEMKDLIENTEYICAAICPCRDASKRKGKPCSKPMDNCMVVGTSAKSAIERGFTTRLTKEQALQILDEAEEAALVHSYCDTPDNFANVLCNCCGCHCFSIKSWNKSPSPRQCINARYLVQIDEDACIACEACIDRCQTHALKMIEGKLTRDENRCIGCGLCMYACPTDALSLEPTVAGKIPLKKC